jgi:hypothetical protein
MTEAQIIKRFLSVVESEKIRHPHYRRTVSLASLYTKLVTGEDMDDLMKRFARRETEEAFKQRKDITQHVIKSVVGNIMDVFRKAARSNYRRELMYTDSADDTKTQVLEDVIGRYWQGESLDDWCALRLLELNQIDPNAWMVLEWSNFDGRYQRAQPYPFEVMSESALDYRYGNDGTLLYFAARAAVQNSDNLEAPHDRYTLYLPDRSLSLTKVPDEQPTAMDGMAVILNGESGAIIKIGRICYMVEVHTPHNLGFVPARRVGYFRDPATDGNTFLAPYDLAVPRLLKTIKANSELDLTMALVAFPLTIRYADPCDYDTCISGTLADGSTCPSCHGTGKKKPTSTQEEIVVSLPNNADQLVNLDNLLSYKSPPVDLIRFQDEYVESLTKRAKADVFNSEIFSRKEIADTATSKVIDLQNVYDTLYPYAQNFSVNWEWSVFGIAKITELDRGLYARLIVHRDFKLKSFEDLLMDLKQANETGAGPAIRQHLEGDIARTMFVDEPRKFTEWQLREHFNPFSGMTQDEIMLLLTGDLIPRRKKILYANLGSIFDEIEVEQSAAGRDFYKMPFTMQRELVEAKVTEIEEQTRGVQIPEMA